MSAVPAAAAAQPDFGWFRLTVSVWTERTEFLSAFSVLSLQSSASSLLNTEHCFLRFLCFSYSVTVLSPLSPSGRLCVCGSLGYQRQECGGPRRRKAGRRPAPRVIQQQLQWQCITSSAAAAQHTSSTTTTTAAPSTEQKQQHCNKPSARPSSSSAAAVVVDEDLSFWPACLPACKCTTL